MLFHNNTKSIGPLVLILLITTKEDKYALSTKIPLPSNCIKLDWSYDEFDVKDTLSWAIIYLLFWEVYGYWFWF